MKKNSNQTIYLIIAVAVFAVIGFVIYTKLGPGKASNNQPTQVEVIDPISSSFDQDALTKLTDPTVAKDFTVPIDLTKLGNTSPYGPLK